MDNLAKLVIKRFPENRSMQLMCLRTDTPILCTRCHKTRRAKLAAVVADDWDRILCDACYEEMLLEPEESAQELLPKEWLGTLVSIEEAERDNLVLRVPFRNQAAEWEEFKTAMLEGDEMCEFAGPPESGPFAGKTGYALVRNGMVVKYIVTMTNT